jgi:hypothetical protein
MLETPVHQPPVREEPEFEQPPKKQKMPGAWSEEEDE